MTSPTGPSYYGSYQPPSAGPPPKKSRTALISAVVVVVVVLGALGITGFVAPGFLLSTEAVSDDGYQRPEPEPEPQKQEEEQPRDPNWDPDAEKLAEQVVAKLTAKDQQALKTLACEDAGEDVQRGIQHVDEIESLEVSGAMAYEHGGFGRLKFVVTTPSGELSMTAGILFRTETDWCWYTLDPDVSAPAQYGSPWDHTNSLDRIPDVVTETIDRINAGDVKGAKKRFCKDSLMLGIEEMVERRAKITIVESDEKRNDGIGRLQLTGTITGFDGKREKTTGDIDFYRGTKDKPDWCVGGVMFSPA